MPNSDRDSSPELSEEPDSPIEEEEEEIEEEVEEEEEEEVEEEEEEEEEEEPESIREEEKGDGEEEEAEYEREEEEGEEEEEEVGEEREEVENEEETKDTSKIIDSERYAGDLNLVSSIPGRSEPASSNNDITGDCIVGHDPSVKTRAAEDEDSDTRLADVRLAVQETHVSSGGKCCSELLGDQTEVNVSLEKKTSSEDPGNVRNFYLQAHGSGLLDLSPGDTISSKNIAPLQVQDKELGDTTIVKSSSMTEKFDGILEKEVPPLDQQTDLKTEEDPSLSSLHTAKRRPRSSSPSAIPENSSKKPAITCSFYARGWCIKGSSCRFLHQKEGTKEDPSEPSRKGDLSDGTGSEREAERSRISSSQERQDPSFSENSSKSPLQMQRALIRAYGGETQGSPHVHGGEEFHRVDIPQVGHTLIQGEHKSPIGVSPGSDHMDEGQPGSEHLLSMRYLHEEKSQQELIKRDFLTDSPFSRDSCLAKRSEHRYYSGGSSASSSLYINNNNPFADGRRPDGIAFGSHDGRLPSHGSQSSYGLGGSLNSAFISSYQPAPGSSFSSESLDIHKTFEFEKACHGFRSASLPRSSPPYSRPAVENGMLRNMRDIPASFRQRMETQENSWEPSIPFRPSFHYVPPTSSSSGSQYDPLLDSIEPHNTGSIVLQSSEKTINVNISDQSIKGDPLLYRSRILEYNMERPLSFFPKPQEGMSDKSKARDGLTRQTSLTATPGHTKIDGGNSSVPKEHPGPLVESVNVNGTEHGSDLRYQVEKSKTTKESKAMKIFRAALVDLVKELVKPAWREGHLSKDAHKTVVKKAVEKVLSALQAHQIPSTTESINQYLSTSRPKILKLVEGYVEKYSKS